jgi:hypothetical protein
MYLPGSDCQRPYRAVFIMMRFADRGGKSAYTDTVAAHERILCFTGVVDISHIHGFGVFGSQLEDITYLDATGDCDGRLFAVRADAAFLYFGKIMVFCIFQVTGHVEPGVMVFVYISATGKIIQALKGTVKEHGKITFQVDRAYISGIESAFPGDDCRMDFTAQIISKFGFIYFEVAADEQYDIMIIQVTLVDNCLAGVLFTTLQKLADVFNRMNIRSVH